jgi:hypothetical protein
LTLRELKRNIGGENANNQTRKILNESATSLIVAKIAAVMFEKAAKRWQATALERGL